MPSEGALRDRVGTGFQLIETLRFEQGEFVRLEAHLGRLAASADTLGFGYGQEQVVGALEAALDGDGAQRVRLTLAADGAVSATCAPFAPRPADTVWRLAIAQTRLDSSDMLLRHKTSRRAVYEAARGEYTAAAADEVLLLNERGELCEGTITTLFADFGEGVMKTPPLSSGLLNGVLRGELLAAGAAREEVLTPEALSTAEAVYVGNSLRGLIRARLGTG